MLDIIRTAHPDSLEAMPSPTLVADSPIRSFADSPFRRLALSPSRFFAVSPTRLFKPLS